jgi:hypothetical protein
MTDEGCSGGLGTAKGSVFMSIHLSWDDSLGVHQRYAESSVDREELSRESVVVRNGSASSIGSSSFVLLNTVIHRFKGRSDFVPSLKLSHRVVELLPQYVLLFPN